MFPKATQTLYKIYMKYFGTLAVFTVYYSIHSLTLNLQNIDKIQKVFLGRLNVVTCVAMT